MPTAKLALPAPAAASLKMFKESVEPRAVSSGTVQPFTFLSNTTLRSRLKVGMTAPISTAVDERLHKPRALGRIDGVVLRLVEADQLGVLHARFAAAFNGFAVFAA